jgi:hypothetical protein
MPTEGQAGTDSESRKEDELPYGVGSLKEQLRIKLGLAERPTEG